MGKASNFTLYFGVVVRIGQGEAYLRLSQRNDSVCCAQFAVAFPKSRDRQFLAMTSWRK